MFLIAACLKMICPKSICPLNKNRTIVSLQFEDNLIFRININKMNEIK